MLLTSTMHTSFIQEDIETIGRSFPLDVFIGSGARAAAGVLRRAMRADVSISWFGSVYSFFMVLGARIGRRRSAIVIGGVDAARNHQLGYGVWTSRWKSLLLEWALRNADSVLVVDMSLKRSLRALSGWDGDTIEYLPTGYDAAQWRPGFPKEPLVLTIATCDTEQRMKVKGLDLVIEAARRMPHVRFAIVGIEPAFAGRLGLDRIPNLELIPRAPRQELLRHYQRAKVYCLASRHEGLPNALCEAMLCGCIPVGTDVGGVRTAIDDCGFVVPAEDVDALCGRIADALALPEISGFRGRRHIAVSFPSSSRQTKLVETIRRLADA